MSELESGRGSAIEVETRDLAGTVVVVTGAGGGIGGATARLLLQAGACVVAGDLRADAVHGLTVAWGPERVATSTGDIREPATADALIETAVTAFGRVDSVIANAAVGFYGGVLDVSPEQVDLMVDVNVKGTVWLARAAVARFRHQSEGGDLVVLGSVAGLLIGGAAEAVYAATKGAQINFATALDRELRSEGIRTTVIAPAGVNTPFAAADGRFGGGDPADGPFMHTTDIAAAIVHTLRQPRRMRTELWTMWSLSENH